MLLSIFTFLSYVMAFIMLVLFLAPFYFAIQDAIASWRDEKDRRKEQ